MLVLAFYSGLALFMTLPLISHISDHIPGSLGDPQYNIWAMDWNRYAVTTASENILDTNIFYPHTKTLYFSDPLIFESVLNALLMLIWKNPVFVYNLLFLLTFVLCGMGMYCLVYHLTGLRGAAILAGIIFSYFPNKFSHLPHLEILFFGWMPLVFLFLHKFFKKPNLKHLSGFVVFFIFQAVSCSYYAVYTTVFVLLFIIYFAYQKGWFLKRDFLIKMAGATFLIVVVLLPLFFPYIAVSQESSFSRPLEEVKFYSAQPKDFFSVPPWNRTYGKWRGGESPREWQIFPGLLPLFLTFCWWRARKKKKSKRSRKQRPFLLWDVLNAVSILFISWLAKGSGFILSLGGQEIASVHNVRNPLVLLGISIVLRIYADRKNLWMRLNNVIKTPIIDRLGPKGRSDEVLSQNFYLFSTVLASLLVMGPVITVFGQEIIEGPYFFFFHFFPGFKGLRVPPRFIVIVMLGLAVLSAWGVAGFIKKKSSATWKVSILAFLGVLALTEYVSLPLPLAKNAQEIPPIFKTIKGLPEKTVLLKFPMPRTGQYGRDAELMFYSMYHRKRLVNGYSGYFPPGYQIIREAMEFFPSRETFTLLSELGVDYVLVQTNGYRPWLAKFAVERLAESPEYAELVERQENDYLYRLIQKKGEPEELDTPEAVGQSHLWKAVTNRNPDLARLAFDGDLTTGWNTGNYQEKYDYFSLDLGEPLKIRRVELYTGPAFLEFPRGYRLVGSADGQNWVRLSERRFNFPKLTPSNIQDFSQYKVEMSFGEIEVRYLTVSLVKTHEPYYWSIYEIVCR
jgi:hypothetical protein